MGGQKVGRFSGWVRMVRWLGEKKSTESRGEMGTSGFNYPFSASPSAYHSGRPPHPANLNERQAEQSGASAA